MLSGLYLWPLWLLHGLQDLLTCLLEHYVCNKDVTLQAAATSAGSQRAGRRAASGVWRPSHHA